jgi:hypothetical protein
MNRSALDDDPWWRSMRAGDFSAAWRISDQVLQRRLAEGEGSCDAPRHEQLIWRGQSLAGKRVLVRCYHGLGDTLQFLRFAAPLRRVARETVFWVQPSLMKLVASVDGVDRVLALHDGAPDVDYDVDIEIMELAHALRVNVDTVGKCVPYVKPSRGKSRQCRRSRGRPRVGLAWVGGNWDPRRTLPTEELERLGGLRDLDLCSLQHGAASITPCTIDLACEDIDVLARRMSVLDLVVSVDTMTAHLAGAMGIPTWTLLPTPCDWRWLEERDDSPWYPSMRLYRQRTAGDWHEVITRVSDDLRDLRHASG